MSIAGAFDAAYGAFIKHIGAYKMSILNRIFARLFGMPRSTPSVEQMPLRDWADLPVYHPRCE